MAFAKFRLQPHDPPKLTPGEKARLVAMTDAQITTASLSDTDNPPLADAEIERFAAARLAKRARRRLGLTQKQFAERFHINYGRLRDIEQVRYRGKDSVIVAYLRVIEMAPETVLKALNSAA